MDTAQPSLSADDLLKETIVWDNHGCMPLRPDDDAFLPQLRRYREARVDVAFLNVGFGEQGVEEHVRMLAHFRRWLLERPDEYVLIETVTDIERLTVELRADPGAGRARIVGP